MSARDCAPQCVEAAKPLIHQLQIITEPDAINDNDLFEPAEPYRLLEKKNIMQESHELQDSDSELDMPVALASDHSDDKDTNNVEGGTMLTRQDDGTGDSEQWPGKECEAPLPKVAKEALDDLKALLNPSQKTGRGYIGPNLDIFVRTCMEAMQAMLNLYLNPQSTTYGAWRASSEVFAVPPKSIWTPVDSSGVHMDSTGLSPH
jgi:hypothetical protein